MRKSRKLSCEWNHEMVVKLIKAVKNRPILWDTSLPAYKNRIKRDSEWKIISIDIFNNEITDQDLNMKWQNLRCQYKYYCNKMKYSKSGQKWSNKYLVKWKYFKMLKFINTSDDVGTLSGTVSNLTSNNNNDLIDESSENSISSCDSSSSSINISSDDISSLKSKRMIQIGRNLANTNLQQRNAIINNKNALKMIEKPIIMDECQIFADYVGQQMREMSIVKRKYLEKKIQRAILEILDEPEIN